MRHKPNKLNKESQHFYIPIPIRNRFKKNPHNASVSFVRNIKTLFYFIVITLALYSITPLRPNHSAPKPSRHFLLQNYLNLLKYSSNSTQYKKKPKSDPIRQKTYKIRSDNKKKKSDRIRSDSELDRIRTPLLTTYFITI
jgi:hypothetical protein